MLLFTEFLRRLLEESDPFRPGTQLIAAIMVAGVAAAAIAIFSRLLLRRLRSLRSSPFIGQDEQSLLAGGWAHYKSGREASAISLFAQALALNPESLEARKGRGLCYSDMGEHDLAMQDFHGWVLRAPKSGEAFFHRARMWQKVDHFGLAISDYCCALKFSPSNAAAREALVELVRSSAFDCAQSDPSLAALIAAEELADGSLHSNPEPTSVARQ